MQNLMLTNKDGEKLAAYLFEPPAQGKYTLIICHGFRGAKENGGKIFGFAEKILKLGIGVLAFDFRGSGQSDGDFSCITLSRQADDLGLVIDYVCQRYSLPVILLGRSFGGSTVLAGGSGDARIAGYILWSTPVFIRSTFTAILPAECHSLEQGNVVIVKDEAGEYTLQPDFISDLDRHDMDAYLRNINPRPVLIVHARDDEVVKPANAEYMQKKLSNSTIHMIEQAGHRFLDKIADREDLTINWLRINFDL